MSRMSAVASILNEAQKSFAVHQKCKAELQSLMLEDQAAFAQQLAFCISKLLLVWKREACVERCFHLIAELLCEAGQHGQEREAMMAGLIK